MTLRLALLLIGFTAATAGNAADNDKSELVDPATIPAFKERDERLTEGPSLHPVNVTLDEDFHFFGSPLNKQALRWRIKPAQSEFVERTQLLPRRPGRSQSGRSQSPTKTRPPYCPTQSPTTTLPTYSPTQSPTTTLPTYSTTQSPTTACPPCPTQSPTATCPTYSPTQSPTTTSPVSGGTSSINSAKCGLQSISRGLQIAMPQVELFLGRIVGGTEVARHSIPWQVLVLPTIGGQDFICGGSLITDQWILTAAHCIHPEIPQTPVSVRVVLGGHRRTDRQPNYIAQTVVEHADYDPDQGGLQGFANDVALLKLPSAITFTNSINSVCLASVKPAPGTQCTVTGWGLTTEEGSLSSVLLGVQLEVLDELSCDPSGLLPGMLCAGFPPGGKGSCQGDSGGPLACLQDGRWTQVGIVSFGVGCALPDYPGVFATVSYYNSWIQSTIGSNP